MEKKLYWGHKELRKDEQQYLNESLDKMLLKMAEIASDIRQLTDNFRQYIEETKEVQKGVEELSEVLTRDKLIELRKGLEEARFEMMKQMPVRYILRGEMKNRDVVEMMRRIYEHAKQKEAEVLPPSLIDVLKGKKTVSQFVVEQKKEREKHHD